MKTYSMRVHLTGGDANQLVSVIKFATDRKFRVDDVGDFRFKVRTQNDKRSDVDEFIEFLKSLNNRYAIFVRTYYGNQPQEDLSPLIHGRSIGSKT